MEMHAENILVKIYTVVVLQAMTAVSLVLQLCNIY
jgi:hypothetical protein